MVEDGSSSVRSVDAGFDAPGAVGGGFIRLAVPLINPDASGAPVSGTQEGSIDGAALPY